jgi:hypothetical protein
MTESGKDNLDTEGAAMLLEQYKIRCQEMLVMVPLYKTHVRNFQIIAGAILGGTAFALSRPDSLPTKGNWPLWWAIATLIPVVTAYLMLDILATIYTMQIVGEGIASIERQLNDYLLARLFNWEQLISEPFFTRLSPTAGVINPGWLVGAFGIFIYAAITLGVPGAAFASILRVGPPLAASRLVQTLIALSTLTSVGSFAIVVYTSTALNGTRPLVRAWIELNTGLGLKARN